MRNNNNLDCCCFAGGYDDAAGVGVWCYWLMPLIAFVVVVVVGCGAHGVVHILQ
jgi:hypothetical protein